jgi:FtsP/CotA-like multicopper oxidase with cupredoxin domain
MSAFATNLHFHGLMLPPICHQDDVLKTLIQPGDSAFEYRFQIPADAPPGLYWYHPHPHGFTSAQVRGGASGALIVEGIEKRNPLLSGLPERVLVIRDQDLLHPDAEPVKTDSMPAPQVLRDAEGDVMNMGFDGGRPAKDLTINFVPVAFPDYKPAVIPVRAGQRQFWRLLNASAITYLDLQLVVAGVPQMLGVAALDGIPLGERGSDSSQTILWQSHLTIPPAGRVEFIVKSLPQGVKAEFVTRRVDTGPAGENDPTRPLATLLVTADAPEPHTRLPLNPNGVAAAVANSAANVKAGSLSPELPWLGDARPVLTRKLYFSEVAERPDDPSSPTKFYITVDGEKPELFDPNASAPNIVVHQGDVEDWIIENRTRELHAFHIHQTHFLLLEWNGVPLDEPYLRDTVNVAYWDGQSKEYPRVKLRMDFRDKRLVGTFPYHCHLLEHEDGGMMGTVQVVGQASR